MAEPPLPALVRLALLACPRAYVREYRDEIALDAASRRFAPAAVAANVFRHGLTMRLESASRVLQLSARALVRSPLHAVVCSGTIAVAVAANVAVASVLSAVVLHPFPFANAGRIVALGPITQGISGITTLPYRDVLATGRRSTTLDAVAAYQRDAATLFGRGRPAALRGLVVSSGYFDLLGARAELGRVFDAADAGAHRILVSHALWRARLGADPRVVGSRLRLNDVVYTVVGVMPARHFDPNIGSPETYDYWTVLDPRSDVARAAGRFVFFAFGRLRPNVTFAQADADMRRIMRDIVRTDPSVHAGVYGAGAVPLSDDVLGAARPLLWTLYAAVSLVMIIACANVANLALVRNAARAGDAVVRAALGAVCAQLSAQAIAEAVIIAASGGAAGAAGAALALRALTPAIATLPRAGEIAVDGGMLVYATVLTAAVALVTAAAPALRAPRDIATALRAAARGTSRTPMRRMRFGMVAFEVALAIAVTISAGLVTRSFAALVSTPTGIDARDVYVLPLGSLPARNTGAQLAVLVRRLTAALGAVPGVTSVSATSGAVPFVSGGLATVTVPATRGRPALETTSAYTQTDSGYFALLRVPVLAGRGFLPADRAGSAPVVIVNEAFARRFFGTGAVLGRRLLCEFRPDNTQVSRTIVGTVADTRGSYDRAPLPNFYLPLAQTPALGTSARLLIRTSATPPNLAASIAAAVESVDPALAPLELQPVEALMARSASRARAAMLLFGALAAVALLLALAGIYAVTAYAVEQRTHEFGLRKAIGAPDRAVMGCVLSGALAQASTGIAVGIVVTASAAPLLRALLFATSPVDPLTFVAVTSLLLACAVGAAFVPALRATRLAPAAALRYE